MVYLTGDCHGDFRKIYTFADIMELGEDDHLIVLGDMGLLWRHDRADANVFIRDFEDRWKFNLYFVDGNHENFSLLKNLPVDSNRMGYVSPHIKHLRRGCRYNIGNKDILAIGGADSVDKFRRTEGLSWWKEEEITAEQIDAIPAGHYDYILSHSCPLSIFETNKMYLCTLGNIVDDNNPEFKRSNIQLERLLQKVTFKHWWFGHYHVNRPIGSNFTCLIDGFDCIDEIEVEEEFNEYMEGYGCVDAEV